MKAVVMTETTPIFVEPVAVVIRLHDYSVVPKG